MPILRSHFFSSSYQIAYSLFFGLDLFRKNSLSGPISWFHSPQNFTRSEEVLFWKKPLLMLISFFTPLIMAEETDAEMAEGEECSAIVTVTV